MKSKESDYYSFKIGSLYKLRGSINKEISPLYKLDRWLVATMGEDLAQSVYPHLCWNLRMNKNFMQMSFLFFKKSSPYTAKFIKKNLALWTFDAPIAYPYRFMKDGYLYIRKANITDQSVHDYFNKAGRQFDNDLEELLNEK